MTMWSDTDLTICFVAFICVVATLWILQSWQVQELQDQLRRQEREIAQLAFWVGLDDAKAMHPSARRVHRRE